MPSFKQHLVASEFSLGVDDAAFVLGSLDSDAELGVGLGGDVACVEGKLLLVKVACGHEAAALDLVRQFEVGSEEAPLRNQNLVDAGAAQALEIASRGLGVPRALMAGGSRFNTEMEVLLGMAVEKRLQADAVAALHLASHALLYQGVPGIHQLVHQALPLLGVRTLLGEEIGDIDFEEAHFGPFDDTPAVLYRQPFAEGTAAVEGPLQKALLGAQGSALCLKTVDVFRDHGFQLGRLWVFQIAANICQRAARALQRHHQHEVSQLQRRVVGVAAVGDEHRFDQPDGAVMPQRLLRGAAQCGELAAAKIAAQAFHGPALMALMPELVPERDMVRINTLDQTLSSLSAIGGPALGMLLYTLWGFAAVLVMDAACAVLACLCLAVARLPYARSDEKEKRGVAVDLREGIGAIAGDPGISALLLMTMAAMLLFMPLGTLSPLLTYEWFGGDGFAASVVEAAGGIGLLVGSIFMMAWGGGKRLVPVLAVAGVVIGICCIVSGLLPRGAFPAFVIAMGLALAGAAFNAPIIPLMQKRVDPAKFGRVMGLFGALTTLAYPVGLFIAGPAAEALGLNRWFVVIGVALCVLMLAFFLCRPLRALDDAASDEQSS